MSLFNKKSSSDFNDQPKENDTRNKLSLLILLVLGGIFAYLYFFTSLIIPHEESAPKPAAAPPEVKQSMPPRPADTGATAPVTAVADKAAETKPPTAAPAAAQPMVPPAAPAATPPAVKPAAPVAPATAKPALPPAAPAAAKPVPAPQPPQAGAKTAPPTTAPASAAKKQEAAKPGKTAEAKPAVKKEEPKSAKAAVKAETAKSAPPEKPVKKKVAVYTLAAGELQAGAEVAKAESLLEKNGVKPVLKQVSQKGREMNRLLVNSFSDYDAYSSGMETLKKVAPSAFGLEKDGNYLLFAGSFKSADLAQKEQQRLLSKGVKTQIRKTVLPGSTVKLTAGSFASKAAADKAAAALTKEGLAVKVIAKGK